MFRNRNSVVRVRFWNVAVSAAREVAS